MEEITTIASEPLIDVAISNLQNYLVASKGLTDKMFDVAFYARPAFKLSMIYEVFVPKCKEDNYKFIVAAMADYGLIGSMDVANIERELGIR